jgi:hypothetical protein
MPALQEANPSGGKHPLCLVAAIDGLTAVELMTNESQGAP